MRVSLTRFEADVLESIVNERIAGGCGDLAEALGRDEEWGERAIEALERIAYKLAQ